ncbi:Uncharacterised protein [Serratia fonticola]|uniref:Transposase n=1 Tax=Serratia fonticola TaxID=47917 RepID=A0A4U9TPG3_SERFO|nr:Uncharacterised protein [Serratia fonticola]
MSDKELVRAQIIQSVCEKRLRRRDAASQLDLSERQVQRLMDKFRLSGTPGLASLKRGKPGNHNLPEQLRMKILALLREKIQRLRTHISHRKAQRAPPNIDLCRNRTPLDDC